jgi:hypothetical protein
MGKIGRNVAMAADLSGFSQQKFNAVAISQVEGRSVQRIL